MDNHNGHDCPQGALKALLSHSTLQLSPLCVVWRVHKRVQHLLTVDLKRPVSLRVTAIYCPARMEVEIVDDPVLLPKTRT